MKKLFFTLILAGFAIQGFSQQLSTYSQYMLNKYDINPAVAGTTNYNPITLAYRQLWTGLDEAPSTQTASSHIALSEKVGVGGKIFNISTGPITKTGMEATYAYSIPVGTDGTRLSFGLSGMLYQFHLDKSKLVFNDMDDPIILFGSEKLMVPDASFGTYIYNERYYGGFAIYQLFNRQVDLMNDAYIDQRQVRHYFLHGGYDYIINEMWSVEPSLLLKFIEAGKMQVDINVKGTYKQMLWAGLSYRTQDAVVIMVGAGKKRFEFGYSYDIVLSDMKYYCNGTHGILFTYKLSASKPKL
ncbi:MAG: hypothetical protein A2W91_16425 [Bacteroidetes bacterium GWF2_38_335]|nr:MAG: hypothetical protein A2W91_16425 [Bacteroidetes bacterium GWF2_38_335]OFY81274.1 MAG: hypothetical protein A2281_07400 [Bacteroidetes bacterium RIFOXYA12_FULL_38_20]HBS85393.1 hypothetical protein [Bacteroidales bacterium]